MLGSRKVLEMLAVWLLWFVVSRSCEGWGRGPTAASEWLDVLGKGTRGVTERQRLNRGALAARLPPTADSPA